MIKSQASRFESFFPCFKKRRRGQLQHVACLLKLLETWLAHTLLWSVIHKISKAPTLWLILAIFRPFTDVFKSQSHCHAHKLHSMVVLPHHGLNLRKRVIACHISLLILFFKFVSTWISGSTREEVEESFHSNTKWHFVMEGICHFSKHLKRQANVLLTAMVSFPLPSS